MAHFPLPLVRPWILAARKLRSPSRHSAGLIRSEGSIASQDKAPQGGEGRQRDTKHDYQQGNLQPDETTDFSEDELNSGAPGRWNSIADAFDTALNETLSCCKRFRFFVECCDDEKPRQNYC